MKKVLIAGLLLTGLFAMISIASKPVAQPAASLSASQSLAATPSPQPASAAEPPAPAPQPTVVAAPSPQPSATIADSCNPNYTPCLPNSDSDLNCKDIGFAVTVVGTDVYHLDRDGDGEGCESYR